MLICNQITTLNHSDETGEWLFEIKKGGGNMPRNKIMSTAEIAEATDWRNLSWYQIYHTYLNAVHTAVDNRYSGLSCYFGEGNIDVYERRYRNDVKKALIVISGTHGVEGPAGSFVQMRMAQDEFFLGLKDTMIIFIHALNPFGYMEGRRTNAGNVDINRNGGTEFVTRSGYDSIHNIVMPKNWDVASVKHLRKHFLLDPYTRKKFMSGQYDFPSGIFYGGKEPSRSVDALRYVCERSLSCFEKVSVLDIHTGLGEWGKVTTLSPVISPDDPVAARTKNWLAGAVEFPNIPKDGNLVQQVSGDILSAMIRFLPNTEVAPIALEFGTMPLIEYFPYFVGENWIYHNPGRLSQEEERVIREKFWELFYPSENRVMWLDGIWEQSRVIAQQMIAGMSET
jgi:hypothetical protein